MQITIIAAIGKNRELGKNNELLWYLPNDLKFFKEQTLNKVVIMGRKTYESLPVVLKNRDVWVLSSAYIQGLPPTYLQFSTKELVLRAIFNQSKEIMIAGGGTIYREFLPFSDVLLLTEVDAEMGADVFFPSYKEIFQVKEEIFSQEVDDKHQYRFKIKKYERFK